jgi:hypothetical protein
MHCLLAYYEVIHWCLVSRAILYNVRLKADLLAGQVFYKRGFNVTHLVNDESADILFCNRNALTGPFFHKKGGPHLTLSQAEP